MAAEQQEAGVCILLYLLFYLSFLLSFLHFALPSGLRVAAEQQEAGKLTLAYSLHSIHIQTHNNMPHNTHTHNTQTGDGGSAGPGNVTPLTRNWIVFHRPESPSYTHAGLLMALGLAGHLSKLSWTDLYR